MQPTLIVLAGPTAVGKTELSLSLAKRYQSVIISADSRQFYRDLRIGTARITETEMQGIPHHFVGHLDLTTELPAGTYEHQVLEQLETLFEQNNPIILTGGSGLFIDAVVRGLDPVPPANADVRQALEQELQQHGLATLVAALEREDPEYAKTVDTQNPRRVLRALEVIRITGQPYSALRKGTPKTRPFRVIKICLERDRAELYERINTRTLQMMEAGLLEEVSSLTEYRNHNALQTVGYRELFAHLEGKYSLEEAVALIQQNTRRYAKRQLTWFRKDSDYHWFHPTDEAGIVAAIERQLHQD